MAEILKNQEKIKFLLNNYLIENKINYRIETKGKKYSMLVITDDVSNENLLYLIKNYPFFCNSSEISLFFEGQVEYKVNQGNTQEIFEILKNNLRKLRK